MSSLIKAAMEDHYDDLVDNEGMHTEDEFRRMVENNSQMDEVADDLNSYQTAKQIETILQRKVETGADLSDEEIYIATETIGSIYSKSTSIAFKGFGFEQYEGKVLTQSERSKIALEAITNQNADRASTIKAKLERFSAGLSDYASWFTGNMQKLKVEAQEVLDRVRSSEDRRFLTSEVTDKRVALAVQRGYKQKPFSNYKEVLSALADNLDSLKVVSSASKYETLGSGQGSKYDLAQLAKDLQGKVIHKAEGTVTYDLNPNKLTGALLTVRIPDNSDNGYLMRNLKANFVIQANHDMWSLTEKASHAAVKTLSKAECIQLLEAVISHIDEQEREFKLYYKDAKIGWTDLLKLLGKAVLGGLLMGYNSMIYRARVQDLNTKLHYMNRACLRGMIAWAASSMR